MASSNGVAAAANLKSGAVGKHLHTCSQLP